MWEAMKGDMTGWLEVRSDGPKVSDHRRSTPLSIHGRGIRPCVRCRLGFASVAP
jgi:hypothetical protein